eukprot:Anaeramoba_ignava/a96231_8.p1 GENE.a96231_8~~a96231_8.p1  ORF type:complete len:243 (-),score=10.71 a96231_8:38-766(-)
MKQISIIFIIILSLFSVNAKDNNNYIDYLKDIYKKMLSPENDGEYKCLGMEIFTGYKSSKMKNTKDSLTILMKDDKIALLNKDYDVYYDYNIYCMVMHKEKSILLVDNNSEHQKLSNLNKLNFLDSLIKHCTFDYKIVNDSVNPMQNIIKMDLQVDSIYRNLYGYKSISYIIDSSDGLIKEMLFTFVQAYPKTFMKISYSKTDEQSTTSILDDPIDNIFYDENKQIAKKYFGYKIIDERKNK